MAKPITWSGHVPDQEKPIHDDKERAAPSLVPRLRQLSTARKYPLPIE
jgi:hypothetical protein